MADSKSNEVISPREKALLITGFPGTGKTTLIRKIAEAMKDLNPVGFYTTEIREGGIRKGFELVSLDGRKKLLSHVDIRSRHRVGKYKVDMEGFEDLVLSIPFLEPEAGIVIIDEIGKMECLSVPFTKRLAEILDSKKLLIATIPQKGSRFIEAIKRRNDVRLFKITERNRDSLLLEISKEARMLYGQHNP